MPEETAERLQWALRHEKWSVATWAKGAWTSAAVLRMRYHAEALKWKAINIDIWGCIFWRELGPLVVDRFGHELDGSAPDAQRLSVYRRPEHAQFIVCTPPYDISWDLNPVNDLLLELARKFERRLCDSAYGLSTSDKAMEYYRQIFHEVWGELSSRSDDLIRSMPGRVQAVIRANGGYIDSVQDRSHIGVEMNSESGSPPEWIQNGFRMELEWSWNGVRTENGARMKSGLQMEWDRFRMENGARME